MSQTRGSEVRPKLFKPLDNSWKGNCVSQIVLQITGQAASHEADAARKSIEEIDSKFEAVRKARKEHLIGLGSLVSSVSRSKISSESMVMSARFAGWVAGEVHGVLSEGLRRHWACLPPPYSTGWRWRLRLPGPGGVLCWRKQQELAKSCQESPNEL